MGISWLLKCGSDTVGTITLETFENWHNYGWLKPGPDYERYRMPLEQLLAADREYEELLHSDALVSEEEVERAEDRKESAEQALMQHEFYFEDRDTHRVEPVHEFYLTDNLGRVYWRFGR